MDEKSDNLTVDLNLLLQFENGDVVAMRPHVVLFVADDRTDGDHLNGLLVTVVVVPQTNLNPAHGQHH